MALILDRVNGISNDHRIENLRIVCPNCAATLDTHCGRNLPRERECAGCGDLFGPQHIRQRYCSLVCFNHTRNPVDAGNRARPPLLSTFGVPRPQTRKVERPPYERLVAEIGASSYSAVGRKYGVSDNAVRKWIIFYERERERLEHETERPDEREAA